MRAVLTCENVSKSYGSKNALQNFSTEIPEKSIYGLLGPNGAGKTTLLRIINQITAPDQGSIRFLGEPLQPKHIAKIGYMPEERGLYKKMKVGEQAIYFARLKGLSPKEAKANAEFWFEKLGIETWWNKKLNELSKGMGQKVQFVITVIHNPDFLIFDEPFSGFDPVNANLIAKEILELKEQGKTILFSTHRMESVEQMCDHVALIHQSNKILDGPIEKIRNQYKQGKYEVLISPFEVFSQEQLLHFGEVSELKKQENKQVYFKLNIGNQDVNQVLTNLINFGEIHRFQEDIPSMNDVFLQAVS